MMQTTGAALRGQVVGQAATDPLSYTPVRDKCIDAPEKAQPFGQRSKQHLSQLVFGKQAKADCYKVDRYDRDVCTVYVDGKDVGLAQLEAGLAWWFRKYAHERRLRGGGGSRRSGSNWFMARREPSAAVGVAA